MAMTKVFERLYLSDVHDADRLSVYNPLAITAVVNVSMETNQHRRDEIKYVHFPWDESERIPPRRFEQVIAAITQIVRTGNVLVHCVAGSSRSPVIVALYMQVVGYKNFDDAIAELRDLRSVVAPSKLVIESAKAYLEEIR